jgi:hypothetical protein
MGVYDAPFLKVAASGEFWFVKSMVVPEVVVVGTGVLFVVPVHAAARIHAMITIRRIGIQTLFMNGRKEIDLLIIVVPFRFWNNEVPAFPGLFWA